MICSICGRVFEHYASNNNKCATCALGCETCENSYKFFAEYPCSMCSVQIDGMGSHHTSRANPCTLPESAFAC